MSDKKQTAVEQFAVALYEKGFLQGDGDGIQEIVEIFKEMEKEKLKDSWVEGSIHWGTNKTFEQYYNKHTEVTNDTRRKSTRII
jgi:hypothetical protein